MSASIESGQLSSFTYTFLGYTLSALVAGGTHYALSLFDMDQVIVHTTEKYNPEDYDYYVLGERFDEQPVSIFHEKIPEPGAQPEFVRHLSVADVSSLVVLLCGVGHTTSVFGKKYEAEEDRAKSKNKHTA